MNAIRACGSSVSGKSETKQGQPRVSPKEVSGNNTTMKLSVQIPGQNVPRVILPSDVPTPKKRCPIQVGKLYELDDGRIGQCMFIGPTKFHNIGIWVGLQLENGEGKHNGTVKGRRYFLCREGKGIFVRPQRVTKLVTEVSKSQVNPQDKKVVKDPHKNRYLRKESIGDLVEMTTPTYSKSEWLEFERRNSARDLNAQADTDDSGWAPAQYDIKTDYGTILKPISSYPDKVLNAHLHERADHKPGPIETGRIDYKAADYGMHISKIPDTQYNCYNPVSELHKRDNVKTPRKIGAIETGWNTDFQAAKFAEDEATLERQFSLDNNQYLLAYPKHELHKHDGERAVHKPGPIETGRIAYKAAEFGMYGSKIPDNQYDLAYPKHELHKHDGERAVHKPGPIETGRINYKAAEFGMYGSKIPDNQYDLAYPKHELHKHDGERAVHKPGPIETGRINYKAAEFGMYGSKIPDNQYDLAYPKHELHKRDNVKTPRKIGAIETGWNTDFKAAKFAEDEATLERQFSIDDNQYLLSYPKSKLHKHDGEHAEHKPGPIETGTIEYKAAEYNVDNAITDTQYNCYHPVGHLHKKDHVKTPRKIGAIETGWNLDFQGAKFAEDEATLEKQFSIDKNQYLLAYPKKELHKHDGEHAEHKPGAIETGTIDYNAANYKVDNAITDTQYACYHPVSELHKTDSVKTPRKIGAIETGWNEAFDEYNPNVLKKNKVKMPSQRYNTEDSVSSSTENKKDRVHRGEEFKKLKQHVTDEEIDAYLPRRFSSTRNSIDKGTVTKGISRNDFSDGSSSDEAEQDNFSKDILSFARKGLEKRHNLKITVPK